MAKASEFFGSARYLRASDVTEDIENETFVIENVMPEVVGQGEKSKEKLVITLDKDFNGRKCIVLNASNGKILIDAFGDNYNEWCDKKIRLLKVKVNFQGQQVDSIQVKPVKK